MIDPIWLALLAQMLMGGFDTVFHHETTERLAWRPSQAGELRLHGVRNLAYAVLFAVLGWGEPHGIAALALIALLGGELVLTLWDFVEEDRTRKLPASERITHTLLTLNYGVLLAMLVPLFSRWSTLPAAIVPTWHGVWSWLCTIAAAGVTLSGLRDLAAARRAARLRPSDAAALAGAVNQRLAVLVTGGTGFIGSRLVAALVLAGHEVTVLSRSSDRARGLPVPHRVITSLHQIPDDARIDAIVNLAGEPIAGGLWTRARRSLILDSRLRSTRDLVALIERLQVAPGVLISGSAVGWYGLRDDTSLDETAEGTDCFSRMVCVRWEEAALAARAFGVRVVLLRTGLVLGSEGGMLARLLAPFEFALGGRFGDGRQWMSWIHRDDLVRLIIHAIVTTTLVGPVNGTAPEPVRNRDFAASLGRALHRPAILRVPAKPLRLALGAFADELFLGGQRVVPRAAVESGFRFIYPTLDTALTAIAGREWPTAIARVTSPTPDFRLKS